ncbi:YneF family protein, partial [Enterococcus faecalis]|nr:YneF family protein [Enterococcus faecalis]
IVLALAGGTFLGAFLVRKQIEREFAENPRLNVDAVRAMMSSMGQKPNEAKVQQVYLQIKAAQKEASKKK